MVVVTVTNMGEHALNAKSADALLFQNMGDDALNAKSAEAILFVNIEDDAFDTRIIFTGAGCTVSSAFCTGAAHDSIGSGLKSIVGRAKCNRDL